MDLLSLYKAVNNAGVNRVGIADTVGCASPRQVYEVCITTCNPCSRISNHQRSIEPRSVGFQKLLTFRLCTAVKF